MDFKKILDSLIPFLVVGFAIALCIGLLIMFFSIAVWGLVIGGVLWCAALAKNYLFPTAPAAKTTVTRDTGRIIEHEDEQ